jgi:outer membrane protein assembly factor BamE (lipoprotein component of BamABCDE complex)
LRVSLFPAPLQPANKNPIMKFLLRLLPVIGAWLLVAGCSTPASRISKNESAFSEWPAAVQEKIRAGQIDLGFTPEQVKMALGNPERTSTRTDNDGTREVWYYPSKKPRVSFGVGLGTARGNTAYGAGVNVGSGDRRRDDSTRVIFQGGRVSAIETPSK